MLRYTVKELRDSCRYDYRLYTRAIDILRLKNLGIAGRQYYEQKLRYAILSLRDSRRHLRNKLESLNNKGE